LAINEKSSRRAALRRLVPLTLLLAAGALFVALGGQRYLNFAALAANRERLLALVAQDAAAAAIAFILLYAGLVALSFPAAELLTIAGGFLFGRWFGTLYAIVGATAGATLFFFAARAGLARLAAGALPQAARLRAGFRRNAFSYLLVLRLVPLFPFWLVNLVAGAAGLRLPVYVLGTFLGIIPATFVYASLGSGLGTVLAEGREPDLAILFRPGVLLPLIGLAVLALLPVLYRRWRSR
jgi:uncharacterized membrane protein YdjX (TVP38/TMEM64 family)